MVDGSNNNLFMETWGFFKTIVKFIDGFKFGINSSLLIKSGEYIVIGAPRIVGDLFSLEVLLFNSAGEPIHNKNCECLMSIVDICKKSS